MPLHNYALLAFLGLLAALQLLGWWWIDSKSVGPGAWGGSCLRINPLLSQPAALSSTTSGICECFMSLLVFNLGLAMSLVSGLFRGLESVLP
jgi:hypothetical protein